MDNSVNNEIDTLEDVAPLDNAASNNGVPSEQSIFNTSPVSRETNDIKAEAKVDSMSVNNQGINPNAHYEDIKPAEAFNPMEQAPTPAPVDSPVVNPGPPTMEEVLASDEDNLVDVNGFTKEDYELVGKQEPLDEKEVYEHVTKAYKSNMLKSIVIFLLLGINEFFVGPRLILKYGAKYLLKTVVNMMGQTTNITTIKLYAALYYAVLLGFLIFFFILVVYSAYNLIKKGFELENFQRRIFELFAYSLLIGVAAGVVTVFTNIDLVYYVYKVVTFNELIFKTSLSVL